MKVFIDDSNENVTIVQNVPSASSMVSSLAGIMRDYIISQFPKNFFKRVYIDTAQTVSEQRKNDAYNMTANKISYPSMAITPEISLDDPIGGMEKSLQLASPNLFLRKDIRRTYKRLVVDPESKFSVSYSSDYITTNFNFKLTTNTYMQNIDMAFYLKSRFQEGMFQYLNDQYLQTEVPKTFVKIISNIHNWDLNNPDDMDKMRLYLIGTGKTEKSIKKRINTSTGKPCFFLGEKVNLLTLMSDLDCPPSIVRDGFVEGEYQINFRLQVSCHMPNAFIMNIDKRILDGQSKDELRDIEDTIQDSESTKMYSLLSTYKNALTKKETIYFADSSAKIESDGKAAPNQIGVLTYSEVYLHEINKKIPVIYLMDKIRDTEEFIKIHSYSAANKLNLTSLVHCRVLSSDRELKEGIDFIFDRKQMKLRIISDIQNDFAVHLYINRIFVETIQSAMEKDKKWFTSNIMTYIDVISAGKKYKIPVKFFEDERDIYSSSFEKALRVKTIYGIGYIPFSEDIKEGETYIGICVSTSENSQVIKKIKLETK